MCEHENICPGYLRCEDCGEYIGDFEYHTPSVKNGVHSAEARQ